MNSEISKLPDLAHAVVKGKGGTASERYLAKLCDRSFLNLWSYPNVYIDKRKGGKGDGKELCDLLVVCGDHVLIFSDKTIGWQDNENILQSWKRWFNRAIHHSARQIRKAERWIEQMPDKIYLDKSCTRPFPFKLPPPERRQVHGIIVALGAGEACKQFFGEKTGSLMIYPELKGEQHLGVDNALPFVIGDIDPDGTFIHILDDATLDIVMRELDTVVDFTNYLKKKTEFIRSGRLISACGEEDLVAYYMLHMNPQGEHDFTHPNGRPLHQNEFLNIVPGHYEQLQINPQYIAKKQADQHSYVWDKLITTFTDHMIAGTAINVNSRPFFLADSEQAVRYMALMPRLMRRFFGNAILDVYKRGHNKEFYARTFLPSEFPLHRETAFIFMTFSVPEQELPDRYAQYREVRQRILETYALSILEKYPAIKQVIGIATEPMGSNGSSEDIIFVKGVLWTPELKAELHQRRLIYNVMQDRSLRELRLSEQEFPSLDRDSPVSRYPGHPGMNRKERRAMKAQSRQRGNKLKGGKRI